MDAMDPPELKPATMKSQVQPDEPQVDVLVIGGGAVRPHHSRTYSGASSLSGGSDQPNASVLLNVSSLGSEDGGSHNNSGSSASTLTNYGDSSCDNVDKSCNRDSSSTGDIIKDKPMLCYAVMRQKSPDQNLHSDQFQNTLGLKVHLVKGMSSIGYQLLALRWLQLPRFSGSDEVDKALPRPDPEGQTESGGNSASSPSTDEDADSNQLATIDITNSPAFKKLEHELQNAKQELQLKEKEVDKLSKIRDEVCSMKMSESYHSLSMSLLLLCLRLRLNCKTSRLPCFKRPIEWWARPMKSACLPKNV